MEYGRGVPLLDRTRALLPHVARFAVRVIRRFAGNKGLLLASAVGYNFLLSLVPLLALVLIAVSQFVAEERLLSIVTAQVRLLVPGEPDATRATLESLFAQRQRVGLISLGAMVVFSSLAFRILESAMLTIFHRHGRHEGRSLLVSLLMPVGFSLAIMFLLAAVTTAIATLDVLGSARSLGGVVALLSVAAYLGLVAVFFAFYRLMPIGRVSSRRALAGAFVAATLWELVRRVLHWYFANLSVVGILYGSLSAIVVIMLSMEVAAVIILLGAQVIAELEASSRAGLEWHEAPAEPMPPSLAPAPPSDL